jgi:short-subunit dehydrogenase
LHSLYNSTKWAVEGFSESLQYELKHFNIKVKIIEPGLIKTDFYKSTEVVGGIKAYDNFVAHTTRGKGGAEGIRSPAIVVAKTIFRAAIDNKWRLRYRTGKYAGMVLTLRRLLPDSIFQGVIRRASRK